MTTSKRDGVALWEALEKGSIDDDIEEFASMSDAELDQYIAGNGGNPAAIRASGSALVTELFATRERLAWHGEMDQKLAAFRDRAAAAKTKTPLPRAELRRRLDLARNDPRFAAPVAALFQKKTFDASTDEELQALLDQIDLLGTLDDE
jgi:hypothetical protein